MLNTNILSNVFKYLNHWKDIEKLENINNDLNYKLKCVYKRCKFNFEDNKEYLDLKKLTDKFKRIHKLKLLYNINISDNDLKYLTGVHTLELDYNNI